MKLLYLANPEQKCGKRETFKEEKVGFDPHKNQLKSAEDELGRLEWGLWGAEAQTSFFVLNRWLIKAEKYSKPRLLRPLRLSV